MRLSSEISNVKAWQTYEMCGLPWDCKPRNYANCLVGLFSVLLPILIYGPIELMAQKWLKV